MNKLIVFLIFSLSLANSQDNFSDEILVYFKSGVTRDYKTNKITITDSQVKILLRIIK